MVFFDSYLNSQCNFDIHEKFEFSAPVDEKLENNETFFNFMCLKIHTDETVSILKIV